MSSQHKTGSHPFYIGMYIHINTHIYVHIYTSQKECLHIFCVGPLLLTPPTTVTVDGNGRHCLYRWSHMPMASLAGLQFFLLIKTSGQIHHPFSLHAKLLSIFRKCCTTNKQILLLGETTLRNYGCTQTW